MTATGAQHMDRRRVIVVWFAAIFAVALVARLAATFALKRWDEPAAGANRQLALNLVEYGAFYFREFGYFGPSSVQTPLYPAALAGLFAAFGPENPTAYFVALAMNAVFGGLCAVAVAQLVRRGGGGDAAGIAAGLLTAVWPPQVFAAQFVQPMALVGLLSVLAVALWRRATGERGAAAWLGFSLAAAAATMLQPNLLPALALALVAIPFVRAWPGDVRLRNLALLAACAAIFWVPWIARNTAVHGRALITTRHWQDRWAASNPEATGSDRLPLTAQRRSAAAGSFRTLLSDDAASADVVRMPMTQVDLLSPQQRAALEGRSEADRERLFRAWTEQLPDGRRRWVAQFPLRLAKAWTIDWDHPMSRHAMAMAPRWAAAALSLAALALVVSRRLRAAGPTVAVLACSALAQAFTIASAKQVIALEPLQIALAATAVAALVRVRAAGAASAPAGDDATPRRWLQPSRGAGGGRA